MSKAKRCRKNYAAPSFLLERFGDLESAAMHSLLKVTR